MKKCIKCKEEKSLENFSLRSNKKHYVSECKICSAKRSNKWYWENKKRSDDNRKKYYLEHRDEVLAKTKKWYEKNKERIRKRANELNKTPERRKKANEKSTEWRKRNPEKVRKTTREWKRNNPEKARAHQYVLWAIRLNVIQKPKECQDCKKEKRLDAHHEDYTKPLEVIWLCKLCHEIRHHEEKNVSSTASGFNIHLHRKEGEEANSVS